MNTEPTQRSTSPLCGFPKKNIGSADLRATSGATELTDRDLALPPGRAKRGALLDGLGAVSFVVVARVVLGVEERDECLTAPAAVGGRGPDVPHLRRVGLEVEELPSVVDERHGSGVPSVARLARARRQRRRRASAATA